VSDFESWATHSSGVEEDFALEFESPIIGSACREWTRLADGDVPPRSAFTPRTARAFLGHLVIFERLGDANVLVRLAGTRISTVAGDIQGKTIAEIAPPDVAKRWTKIVADVIASKKPRRFTKKVTLPNLNFMAAEIFMAPLRNDSGQATMAFSVAVFRSGFESSRAVDKVVGGTP
jgi:hypothetical protein